MSTEIAKITVGNFINEFKKIGSSALQVDE